MVERISNLPIAGRALDMVEGAAESAWRLFGKTPAGQIILGPGTAPPAYVKLELSDSQLDPDGINWCEIAGDPDAGRGKIPRNYGSFAVISFNRNLMINGHQADGSSNGRWARDAIVFRSDGEVEIGVNRDSYKLFGGVKNEAGLAVIGISRSRHLIEAAPAVVYPDGEVTVAEEAKLLEFLPVDKTNGYPGISLVQLPPAN